MHRDPLRLWVSRNLHPIVFLGTYFVMTVAGNLLLASPLADQTLRATGSSARFLQFPNTFTSGYWMLLLCPFVLTPIIVLATKRLFERRVGRAARALPEFTRFDYALITSVCFGFVIYRFWSADVAGLFASGADFTSSVEARFTIRERIGFFTFVPLQALLPFLSLYAFIHWIHSRELFWMAWAIVDFFLLSVLLVMINMKWPVLLFYLGLVLTILVYAKKRPYLKTAAGALFLFVAFLLVSTFVWRLIPPPDALTAHTASGSAADTPSARVPTGAATSEGVSNLTGALSETSARLVATTKASDNHARTILLRALTRMAIAYPYYYQVFTDEGAVCGGILAQARRQPSCRPSKLIYTRIFGNNGFENRGTSPLAVHVSGYALGGWPVALLALAAGSVILGLFSALPLDGGPLTGAIVIVGGLAAYHLSQIPGEGVIMYEHGLVWPSLLILGYVFWRRWVSAKTVRISATEGADVKSAGLKHS